MVCGIVGGCIAKLRVRRMSLFSVGKIGGGLVCSGMGVGPRIASTRPCECAADTSSIAENTASSRARTVRGKVQERVSFVIAALLDFGDLDRALLEVGL